MPAISGILLGIINIAIVVVLLLLIGVICWWLLGILHLNLPGEARRLYLVLVGLIALYMFVALIFGLPSVSVLR